MTTSTEFLETKKITLSHAKALMKMGQKVKFCFVDEGLNKPEGFCTSITNFQRMKEMAEIHPKGAIYYTPKRGYKHEEQPSETNNKESSNSPS